MDDVTPLVVQKLGIQAGKKKGISSSVDLGDLPTPKVPKFPSAVVHLDASAMNLVPQTTPSVQTTPPIQPKDLPLATKAPHKAHPSKKTKRPSNLVLDESYAWRMFKEIIIDNEVNSCYNKSVKDFERFSIHGLFKVCGFHYFPFIF